MSTNRKSPDAGFANHDRLQRGPNGRYLCRKCGRECPAARMTFCSKDCVHEWKMRTQPGYVRQLLRHRDKGVCRECGIDTYRLHRDFNALHHSDDVLPLHDHEISLTKRWPPFWRTTMVATDPAACRARLLGFDYSRRTWWDANHIIPVVEGGGECGLENMETLCQSCHKAATKELARRRRIKK